MTATHAFPSESVHSYPHFVDEETSRGEVIVPRLSRCIVISTREEPALLLLPPRTVLGVGTMFRKKFLNGWMNRE